MCALVLYVVVIKRKNGACAPFFLIFVLDDDMAAVE